LIGLGINEDRIVIAQNTVNIEKIHKNRSSICAERSFNEPTRFLYVGALIHRKFVISSVIAVKNLIDEGANIVYNIVGDGEEYKTIKKYIDDNNLSSSIILHGAKHGDEVKAFFENNDVFILPGTGGLAINEAMAYSMPIISTIGDDTVIDLIDGNGFLLNNMGNVAEIKEKMKKFIGLTREEKKINVSEKRRNSPK
jgi:Glycosyltransferase